MKNALYLILKARFVLLFSRYLRFCHDVLSMQEKWLDKKDKANFKVHDVTTWLTNTYGTHIVHYFTKQMQPDNETWSIDGIQQEKYFFQNLCRK